MYYGIQLKPIDEYTRSFDAAGEITKSDEGFKRLFDENTAELDDEVAKDFRPPAARPAAAWPRLWKMPAWTSTRWRTSSAS